MGKKSKRKTRWRSLPIGEVGSQNEEEYDDTEECGSGSTNGQVQQPQQQQQQNGHNSIRKFRPNNNGYRYTKTQTIQTSVEKKLFNEEEYTKITTPRQDVLFKKGYLGRKRTPVVDTPPAESVENGESQDNQSEVSSETVTSQEQQQIIYTSGYIDAHGNPVYYLNGTYEMYEPYSGVYSSYMVPTTGNGAPATSVLTAVPCQPVPLQPLEWFNPRGDMGGAGWCLVAPCPAPQMTAPTVQRKKRYSTDSQNCSPESPGSPQHEEEYISPEYYQPQAYVYPGYMFGPAVYNVNGVAVTATTPTPQSNGVNAANGVNGVNGVNVVNGVNGVNGVATPDTIITPVINATVENSSSQSKRKKKKRRRKRRRGLREGTVTDEASEESSSEEGDKEEINCEEITEIEVKVNHSSPGDAQLTSESCSELSSSSHNSEPEAVMEILLSAEEAPKAVEEEIKVEEKVEEQVIETEIEKAPLPPPRIKRGRNKQQRPPTPCPDVMAQDISENIITEAISEAVRIDPSSRPITQAVTNWLNTNPDRLISLDDDSDVDEEKNQSHTDSKNGLVNPLPAPSNRLIGYSTDGPEKRVENKNAFYEERGNSASSSQDGYTWDDFDTSYHQDNTTVIKLKAHEEAWISAADVISDSGIESGDEPNSPHVNKHFVNNFHRTFPDTEPFPCGACCNIQ